MIGGCAFRGLEIVCALSSDRNSYLARLETIAFDYEFNKELAPPLSKAKFLSMVFKGGYSSLDGD